MPALGMAQDTGRLIRWLKKEGEPVTKGEPLMEVETDKATVEIEAAASGTLAQVTARDGDTVPVAQVIALIVAPGEAPPTPAPVAPAVTPERPNPGGGSPAASPLASPVAVRAAEHHRVDLNRVTASNGDRISKSDVLAFVAAQPGDGAKLTPASPKARRMAAEKGIALGTAPGSGPGGAVLAADLAAAPPVTPAQQSPAGQMLDTSKGWQVMAARLSDSWQNVPHFYLMRDVDAGRLGEWRELAQKKSGSKITYTDLLVKIAAAALREHPRANGSWNGTGIRLNAEINIGLAVAIEDGLLVPVIHQADRLSLAEIAGMRAALVERAASGKLRLDDLQGGTFTISNLGMYGVDAFNAIVNPPEAAILAVGRIAERVVPVGGQPGIRRMMTLSLSCDHRVIDGARGAQFLDSVASLIEEPMGLIE